MIEHTYLNSISFTPYDSWVSSIQGHDQIGLSRDCLEACVNGDGRAILFFDSLDSLAIVFQIGDDGDSDAWIIFNPDLGISKFRAKSVINLFLEDVCADRVVVMTRNDDFYLQELLIECEFEASWRKSDNYRAYGWDISNLYIE